MYTIGGIDLHEDMFLEPALESVPKIKTEKMEVRNGPALRWEKLISDRPVDIICGPDTWIPLSIIQSISGFAETLNWEGTLNVPGASMTVYFRHSDSPVIQYVPVIDYSTPDSADKVCEVRIKLVWKVA